MNSILLSASTVGKDDLNKCSLVLRQLCCSGALGEPHPSVSLSLDLHVKKKVFGAPQSLSEGQVCRLLGGMRWGLGGEGAEQTGLQAPPLFT